MQKRWPKDTVGSIRTGPLTMQKETRLIAQWLDSRFEHSIAITAFLPQTQGIEAPWQLLRSYDSKQQDRLLEIAVVCAGGTCFWLPEQSDSARLLGSEMFKLQPSRIVTTSFGGEILPSMLTDQVNLLQGYEQWIMVREFQLPQAEGRMATRSDIPRLVEYQHLYNQERSVAETPDWELLIQQAKVAVYEIEGQIVSIVRFGIETSRLVNLGGTYTFPGYRRQGYAARVLAFVVNQIIDRGRMAHLIVDRDNHSAVALYRQIGFKSIGSSYVGYLAYS